MTGKADTMSSGIGRFRGRNKSESTNKSEDEKNIGIGSGYEMDYDIAALLGQPASADFSLFGNFSDSVNETMSLQLNDHSASFNFDVGSMRSDDFFMATEINSGSNNNDFHESNAAQSYASGTRENNDEKSENNYSHFGLLFKEIEDLSSPNEKNDHESDSKPEPKTTVPSNMVTSYDQQKDLLIPSPLNASNVVNSNAITTNNLASDDKDTDQPSEHQHLVTKQSLVSDVNNCDDAFMFSYDEAKNSAIASKSINLIDKQIQHYTPVNNQPSDTRQSNVSIESNERLFKVNSSNATRTIPEQSTTSITSYKRTQNDLPSDHQSSATKHCHLSNESFNDGSKLNTITANTSMAPSEIIPSDANKHILSDLQPSVIKQYRTSYRKSNALSTPNANGAVNTNDDTHVANQNLIPTIDHEPDHLPRVKGREKKLEDSNDISLSCQSSIVSINSARGNGTLSSIKGLHNQPMNKPIIPALVTPTVYNRKMVNSAHDVNRSQNAAHYHELSVSRSSKSIQKDAKCGENKVDVPKPVTPVPNTSLKEKPFTDAHASRKIASDHLIHKADENDMKMNSSHVPTMESYDSSTSECPKLDPTSLNSTNTSKDSNFESTYSQCRDHLLWVEDIQNHGISELINLRVQLCTLESLILSHHCSFDDVADEAQLLLAQFRNTME